jgi:hypothetical protein
MTIDPDHYRATREASFEDIDLDQETVIVGDRRYTEADAAADAARLEARTRGFSRGGHSLSGDDTHSPKVATVLPRDVRDKVRQRADAEGMGVSKWLRRLIEREVA